MFSSRSLSLLNSVSLQCLTVVVTRLTGSSEDVTDAQTAAEAAHIIHKQLKDAGKSSDDIKHVKIRTQEAAVSSRALSVSKYETEDVEFPQIRIIDKSGPLHNFADRDHTIQYMVAVPRESSFSFPSCVVEECEVDERFSE